MDRGLYGSGVELGAIADSGRVRVVEGISVLCLCRRVGLESGLFLFIRVRR